MEDKSALRFLALSILVIMSLSTLASVGPFSRSANAISTSPTLVSDPVIHTLGAPRAVSVMSLPTVSPSSAKPVATPDPSAKSSGGSSGAALGTLSPAKLSVLKKINGLTESQGGLYPPDVQSATGKTQVVEVINAAAEIWTKNGTEVKEFTLSSFLGTGDFIGDPRIEYDLLSGHFFMSVADFYNNEVWLATTKTGDATGTWFIYLLKTTNDTSAFTDQPTMGLSSDKLAISANIYVNGGAPSYFFAFNKHDLIIGSKSPHYASEQSSDFSVHPVHNYSPQNAMYFVSDQAGGVSSIDFFTLTGLPGVSKVHVSVTTLSISFAAEPPSAPQKGTSALINTDDGRMQDAAYYKGFIWLTFEDGCIPKGDSSTRSCARMIELNVSPAKVKQDFDAAAKGVYYYYPALSFTSNGGMIFVFGYSNSNTYPSIAVSGQSVKMASGTWKTPVTVLVGKSYDTDGRWGDYYAAQMDPTTGSIVWVAGQYETAPSAWGTEIASVKL